MDIEDTVEIVEGVLVKLIGARSGDTKGVTTLVEDGTCNEGGEAVGRRDGDDAEIDDPDTTAVGVREREEDGEIIPGDSLGLAVRRGGMRVLGVDSVTKGEVVGSVSGGPMGEEEPA